MCVCYEKRQKTAKMLVNLYVLMTVLYYVLLPYVLEGFPIIASLGGHMHFLLRIPFRAHNTFSSTQLLT